MTGWSFSKKRGVEQPCYYHHHHENWYAITTRKVMHKQKQLQKDSNITDTCFKSKCTECTEGGTQNLPRCYQGITIWQIPTPWCYYFWQMCMYKLLSIHTHAYCFSHHSILYHTIMRAQLKLLFYSYSLSTGLRWGCYI